MKLIVEFHVNPISTRKEFPSNRHSDIFEAYQMIKQYHRMALDAVHAEANYFNTCNICDDTREGSSLTCKNCKRPTNKKDNSLFS